MKCLSESCTTRYINIYEKKNYFTQSSLDSKKCHSTDHATVQFVDQIYKSIENDNYTLRVFIDLFKAFGTVDHSILLKKTRNVRCQYRKSCLVCQLLKLQEIAYRNY